MYLKTENNLKLITDLSIIKEDRHSNNYSVKITDTDRIINLTLQESKFIFNNLCKKLINKEIINSEIIDNLIKDINDKRTKKFNYTTFNKEETTACYTTSFNPNEYIKINMNKDYINSTYLTLKTKSEEDDN